MNPVAHQELSRRERQIMSLVFQKGSASAAEIHAELPDPPSYSAVRALLAVLLRKGHLKHERRQGRYIYSTIQSRTQASRNALQRVLATFFDNSVEKTVMTLLEISDRKLSKDELQRVSKLINDAKRKGL